MAAGRAPRVLALWPLVDHAAWGVLSFALLVPVARTGTPADAGTVAAVLTVYTIAITTIAVPIGDVVLLAGRARDEVEVGRAVGGAISAGAGAAAVVAVVAVLVASTAAPWLALAATLPVLVTHEVVRSVAYGQGAARWAALATLVWLLVAGCWPAIAGYTAPTPVVLAWAAGAAAGLLVSRAGINWSIRKSERFVRTNSFQLAAFGIGDGLQIIATQSALLLSLTVLDLGQFASVRLAIMLFGPLTVVTTAIRRPMLARSGRGELAPRQFVTARLALVGAAPALTVLLMLVPDRLATDVLGELWHDVDGLLIWLGVAFAARGSIAVSVWQLMVGGHHRALLAARGVAATATVSSVVVAAALGAAEGAAVGLAIGNLVGAGAAVTAHRLATGR